MTRFDILVAVLLVLAVFGQPVALLPTIPPRMAAIILVVVLLVLLLLGVVRV